MYGDDIASWVTTVVTLFTLYPPFGFAKVFKDIANYSGNHFDFE